MLPASQTVESSDIQQKTLSDTSCGQHETTFGHEEQTEHKHRSLNEPTLEFFNKLVANNTHCFLGRSGIRVSRICLGSMNFGKIDSKYGERPGQLDESEAHKILDRFVELGGNCIDCADFFPWFGSKAGESERIIGNWLKNQDREKIFLITKIRMPTTCDNVNACGLSRSNIINSIEKCLERLQTKYIDLLLLDGWDSTVNINETVADLDSLIKWNQIRYFGACDFKGWQLQRFCDVSKLLKTRKCVCFEGEYNLLTRGCELEVAQVCINERIGFFAYSPFKYGFLTGAYSEETTKAVEGSRIESASGQSPNLAAMAQSFQDMKSNPLFGKVLNSCEKIAKKNNMTLPQLAISWALQQGFVSSVVVGVSSVNELEENMKVLSDNLHLSYEDMCELNCASSPQLHYPYHTLLSSVAGYKLLEPFMDSSFEQLCVRGQNLSLDEQELGKEYYHRYGKQKKHGIHHRVEQQHQKEPIEEEQKQRQ